jgi:putative endonuclease
MFYVYLLHSISDHGLYIGYSTDLKRRLSQHKAGAAIATKHRGPWKLIYYEAYTEQADAEGRERYLKSGSGRRFLRRQLHHCFKKFSSRVRPKAFYAGLPRLDSNQE